MPRPDALLRLGAQRLQEAGIESPAFDACQLLLHALGLRDRAQLLAHGAVGEDEASRYLALIERRGRRYPLQYLLGFWEFYGRRFLVREGVLIPRPETEHLAERAVALCRERGAPRVLDLCSGSGAIALTLALECPRAQVEALELSPAALAVLRENAAALGAGVEVIAADVLTYTPQGAYDLIVSNPPYIPEGDCGALQPEVQCEPRMALAAGEDGMLFYEAIARRFTPALRPGGHLLLEAGAGQAQKISALLSQSGYQHIAVIPDYSGIGRVVEGERGA